MSFGKSKNLHLINANKLLGETWDFFNHSNSILSKSCYGTSSISLAVVSLAVSLCMGLSQNVFSGAHLALL